MLRQNSDRPSPDRRASNGSNPGNQQPSQREGVRLNGIDIQRELNKLEEIVLDSPRIPLSRRTLIDEEQLLDQLDLIRLSLPGAFHEASELLLHKEEVLLDAEQYAQEIIEAAQQRAAQILDEIGIIRQAEQEAQRIRQQVQQECEAVQQQTIADIEQLRRRAQQELEDLQRVALAECEEIQRGADDYADRVLRDMEQQLNEMMHIIRNGRQQLSGGAANSAADNYPANRFSPASRY